MFRLYDSLAGFCYCCCYFCSLCSVFCRALFSGKIWPQKANESRLWFRLSAKLSAGYPNACLGCFLESCKRKKVGICQDHTWFVWEKFPLVVRLKKQHTLDEGACTLHVLAAKQPRTRLEESYKHAWDYFSSACVVMMGCKSSQDV